MQIRIDRWKTPLALAGLLALTTSFAVPQGRSPVSLRGDRVQCANLIYAGNKTSQCFSDRFLMRLKVETKIQTEPHFRQVRLDSRDLCNYPFAVMTGEGGFRLTEKERLQLRYYLTHGGFLLASAGCSNRDWARSFRAEFARLFPGRQLMPLKLDHPLFRLVYKIESLATRHRPSGAALEAFIHKGRIVLLFSPDGLNDTAHAENCCCCGGDEINRAEFINVNVLAYALLR
ncbi:MAG TPA: DUF4159 domain-containing protein [Chthonomonadaceae bacterium]|nr:DUF4159 domain-containing protein [Chthonomonadaceae bacterium]